MRGYHHPIRLVLVHAELRLQYRDDEFPRRIVVVDENDLVQARPLRFPPNLGARSAGDVAHRMSCFPIAGRRHYAGCAPLKSTVANVARMSAKRDIRGSRVSP